MEAGVIQILRRFVVDCRIETFWVYVVGIGPAIFGPVQQETRLCTPLQIAFEDHKYYFFYAVMVYWMSVRSLQLALKERNDKHSKMQHVFSQ